MRWSALCAAVALVASASGAWAAPVRPLAADAWEPTDNTSAGATALVMGGAHAEHTISSSTDVDWFSFSGVVGNVYEMSAQDVGGTGFDPVIHVDSTAIGHANYNDDALLIDDDASVKWQCIATGTYRFKVKDKGTAQGNYTVGVDNLGLLPAAMPGRLEGYDRFAVAANVANAIYGSNYVGKTKAVLASGLDQSAADPLTASGLAGAKDAPLLLIHQGSSTHRLPSATKSVLQAIKAANPAAPSFGIYLVGGTASVPSWVADEVKKIIPTAAFTRVSGDDRYKTAAAVAKVVRQSQPTTPAICFVANGENPAYFYDALAASPLAYSRHFPILLTRKDSVPAATLNEAALYSMPRVVGNTPEVSNAVVTQLGAFRIGKSMSTYDRTFVARRFAEWGETFGLDREGLYIASKVPDALTGGCLAGHDAAPLLFTASGTSTGEHLTAHVQQSRGTLDSFTIIGGSGSVSNGIYSFLWGLTGAFE